MVGSQFPKSAEDVRLSDDEWDAIHGAMGEKRGAFKLIAQDREKKLQYNALCAAWFMGIKLEYFKRPGQEGACM